MMTPEERRLKKNQESLEIYNWYRAHHVCVRCHNAPAVNGLVTCQACREAMNASNRFRYAALTPEQKAERPAKKKAVREAWQAAGALHPMWQEARGQAAFNLRTLQEKG